MRIVETKWCVEDTKYLHLTNIMEADYSWSNQDELSSSYLGDK